MTLWRKIRWWLLAVLIISAVVGTNFYLKQRAEKIEAAKDVLHAKVDDTLAIRIMHMPDVVNHPPIPLIFRAVHNGDPRLNTSELGDVGRTTYITYPEMEELLQRLNSMKIQWKLSRSVEPFQHFMDYEYEVPSRGEITVVSSRGTAVGTYDANAFCDFFTPLDSVFTTPRAKWEFQRIREDQQADGCKFPEGYDAMKFVDY